MTVTAVYAVNKWMMVLKTFVWDAKKVYVMKIMTLCQDTV